MKIPVYKIKIPEYQVKTKPDFKTISKKIDSFLIKKFLGQKIAIRCLGSQDHPGKTVNQLIKIIKKLGTDRYDPKRIGDRYENIENKKIDFFATDYKINKKGNYLEHFLRSFYLYPIKIGERPIKVDIIILYDRTKLKKVFHHYKDRPEIKNDGFVFKNPENKTSALEGIVRII